MNLKLLRNAAPIACLALVACHIPGMKDNKAPTGQVVATVDGQEVTISDLRAELANAPKAPDPKIAKAMEMGALQEIVARKILAKAAHDQGLDKTPDFAMMKQKTGETMLAQALQRKMASSVLTVSRSEAEMFVNGHPTMFAQRKIMAVEQLKMPRPKNLEELKEFQPLKTMAEVEGLLNKKGVKYQKGNTSVDSLGADPGMMAQIEKLGPGEPFLIPTSDGILVNQIKESRAAPLVGEEAIKLATNALRNQKTQAAVAKGMNNLLATKESTVKYNAGYKPDKPLRVPVPGEEPAAKPAVPAKS